MTSVPPPPPPPSAGEEFIAVPPSGLQAWTAPDPAAQPAGALAPGAPIRVVDRRGAWAQVIDQSGAAWWVDGRLLPAAAPAPAVVPAAAPAFRSGGSAGKWIIGIVVVAAAAVAVFLLTRDGGGDEIAIDDLNPEEQAVAENLADAIASSDGSALGAADLGGLGGGLGGDLGLSAEQTDCIAAGVVSDLGVERLEELGLTASSAPEGAQALTDLTLTEREQTADRILTCVDLEMMITEQLEAQGMDPAIGTCLLDAIGEDTIRNGLVSALGGEELDIEQDPELSARLFTAVFQCLPDDLDLGELGDLGG